MSLSLSRVRALIPGEGDANDDQRLSFELCGVTLSNHVQQVTVCRYVACPLRTSRKGFKRFACQDSFTATSVSVVRIHPLPVLVSQECWSSYC